MKKNFNFLIIIFFILPFSGLSQKSYMIHDTLNGRIKSIKYKISINNNKIDSTFNKYICHLGLYGSFSEENIYIFDFDENGNNIFYNNDDFNNDIKYDNNHQMIEIKKYVTGANKEKYFKKKATCEYFNGKIKNRKSYEYYYDKELLQYEKNAVYDKNLNIIKDSVNFYKKGVFQHSNRIEYKFNEKNQMIECKNISRFGGVEIYKYSYLSSEYNNTTFYSEGNGIILVDPGQLGLAMKLKNDLEKEDKGKVKFVINTSTLTNYSGGNGIFQKNSIIINPSNLNEASKKGYIFSGSKPIVGKTGLSFDKFYRMQFNKEEVYIIPQTDLHSGANMLVYFKNSGVLNLGNLVIPEKFPSVGSNIKNYIAFIKRVLDIFPEDTKFITGKGNELSYSDLSKFSEVITETAEIVKNELLSGKKIHEIEPDVILSKCSQYKNYSFRNRDEWVNDVYVSYFKQ